MKPQLLLISFSGIPSDARVLKQVNLFKEKWDVTTVGYGPGPDGVKKHISIPQNPNPFKLDGRKITFKAYPLAYWTLPGVKQTLAALKGEQFDMVFANEIDAVPLALKIKSKHGVHADLHEYYPSYYEHLPWWNKRIRPYVEWQCSKFLPKTKSITSASNGFSKKYIDTFGIEVDTVINAAPYVDLKPTAVTSPIRLVHHGGSQENRHILNMLKAVAASTNKLTFDLYLTPVDPEYLQKLRDFAVDYDNITVHDAVPYSELSTTLNQYDVGVHVLAPTSFNNLWALPNKLFDFIQARLGVVSGPSPDIVSYVDKYHLGEITEDFSVEALTEVLNNLTVEKVKEWKTASDSCAEELAAENAIIPWAEAVNRVLQ